MVYMKDSWRSVICTNKIKQYANWCCFNTSFCCYDFFFLNYVYDIPLRETYSTKSSVNACCDSSHKRSFCFLYHSSTYRSKSTQGWGTHAVSSYQIADVLKHSSGLWFQTHKSHDRGVSAGKPPVETPRSRNVVCFLNNDGSSLLTAKHRRGNLSCEPAVPGQGP